MAGLLLMVSCDTDLPEIATPAFDVTTESLTYKKGDKVIFKFTGDANIISFYSGERQKQYSNRSGTVVDAKGAGATLSFTSAVSGGTQGVLSTTVPPQLKVMASTNFNGNYDFASVQAATWTDITSRFSYSTTTTFVTSTPVVVPAAPVDISDLIVTGKPLYIAYKYILQPQFVNGTARNWQIQSFLVTSKKDIGASALPTIVDQPMAGFRLVEQNPLTPSRSAIIPTGTARVSLLGYLYDVLAPSIDPAGETWAISKGIDTEKILVAPDPSLPIKNPVAVKMTQYEYIYATAGTYTATFVASNNNLEGGKEVVKEIKLTITP